jgi:hypothetical protein
MLYYARSLSVTDDSAIGLTCSFESLSEQTRRPVTKLLMMQAVFDMSSDGLAWKLFHRLSTSQALVWVANDPPNPFYL